MAEDAPLLGVYWLTVFCYRIRRSFVPDCIEGLVRGYYEMSLSNLEPKTIEGKRFFVVLAG